MNASIHRLGLAVAGLVVVATVGGFFVADGYFSASGTTSPAPVITDGSTCAVASRDRDPAARAGVRAACAIAPGHPRHQDGSSGTAAGGPRHRARIRR